MIDATASLKVAEHISAATLIKYLRETGWSSRPSRIEGIAIFSKSVSGADKPLQFILPVEPTFPDEQRRVADALRTIAQIEGCSEAQVAERAQKAAGWSNSKADDDPPNSRSKSPQTSDSDLSKRKKAFVDFLSDKQIESLVPRLESLGPKVQIVFRLEYLVEQYREMEEDLGDESEQFNAIILGQLKELSRDVHDYVVALANSQSCSPLVAAAALLEWRLEYPDSIITLPIRAKLPIRANK
jgi:hypothetical protein